VTRLIAFTGPAGSGKTTAAEALMEQGWARVKFADPLKNMLRTFYMSCGIDDYGYIEARIEGDMKEEPCPFLRGRTPRHAMQTLGTEWGRSCIAPDVWVSAWRTRVAGLLNRGVDVVTDDCRFENEAEAVRALDGKVVRILGREKGIPGNHASEKLVEPDMRIANASSMEGFLRDVVHIFHHTHY
jgi:hypothetical protein